MVVDLRGQVVHPASCAHVDLPLELAAKRGTVVSDSQSCQGIADKSQGQGRQCPGRQHEGCVSHGVLPIGNWPVVTLQRDLPTGR